MYGQPPARRSLLYHVPEIPVLAPFVRLFQITDGVSVAAVLAIPDAILARQNSHLHTRGDDDEQTGAARDPHALVVIRGIRLRKDIGAQDRPALAAGGEDGEPRGARGIRRVAVGHPGQRHGDRDEDQDGQKQAKVPRAHGRGGDEHNVPDGGEQRRDRDKGPSHADAVGEIGRAADGQETQHIRRR